MLDILANTLGVLLMFISLAHMAWAFGLVWPFKTEQDLTNAVVGHPQHNKMPPRVMTFVVACLIGFVSLVAFSFIYPKLLVFPRFLQTIFIYIFVVVFLARMLVSYFSNGPLGARTAVFERLDRMIYAPLCGLIAFGFLMLAIGQLDFSL